MDKTKKKIWKKVMIYQVTTWVVVVALVTFFYFRSGSITAALTVGLALFLASFRFTYSEYQQAKREASEGRQENQNSPPQSRL